jgi:hypothetical protein
VNRDDAGKALRFVAYEYDVFVPSNDALVFGSIIGSVHPARVDGQSARAASRTTARRHDKL